MSEHTETRLDSREIYDGKVVHLYVDTVRLENGATATREVIRHQGAVCVVPVCDNGDVLLVRQFRYPFGKTLLELPAGKRDPGEPLAACARRELAEETGATAKTMTYLGAFYPSVAYLDEVIFLLVAEGLTMGEAHPDEDEFLDVVRMPLSEAVQLALTGKIPDGKTQAALLQYAVRSHKILEFPLH